MKHKRNVIIVNYMNRRFEVNSSILSSTRLSGSLMCFMPHLLDAWCTLLIIYWGFQYNFLLAVQVASDLIVNDILMVECRLLHIFVFYNLLLLQCHTVTYSKACIVSKNS